MKIKEFLKENPANSELSFGLFVKQRRKELNITLKEFAEMSGISIAYLCDVENGQRYAPFNHLNAYQNILQIDKDDSDLFLDLAYCTKHSHPDINEYVLQNPKLREFLRLAKHNNLSDEELTNLIYMIKPELNPENEEDIEFSK